MALKSYGYGISPKGRGFREIRETLIRALGEEGFGVLTEIDVAATLKKKLGIDFRKYLILGACNPTLAYKALSAEPHVGLLLPCNVVLQESESGALAVSAQSPAATFKLVRNAKLKLVVQEADARIRRVLKAVSKTGSKEVTLDDVKPKHPRQYPAKGLKARLDARREVMAGIQAQYAEASG